VKTLGKDTNDYYRFHSRIYDLTRWAFLHGRESMVREIVRLAPKKVLEIGCGTGRNLIELKQLCPEVECYGVDASEEMLEVGRNKSLGLGIHWIQGRYPSKEVDRALEDVGKPDVILFSYALSMFNPGYAECLEDAHHLVEDHGFVCVVDFHASPYAWFRRWMGMNHVKMESQLLKAIQELGELVFYREGYGMGGIWRYNAMISRPKS